MNDEQRKRLAEELLVRDAERKAAERKADRLEAEVERLREENDDLVTQLSTAVEDVLPPVERELSQALRERDGLRKALERIGWAWGGKRRDICGVCLRTLERGGQCQPECKGRDARAALDGVDERVSIYDYHADGCEFNTGGLMHWDCVEDCPSRDVNGDSR